MNPDMKPTIFHDSDELVGLDYDPAEASSAHLNASEEVEGQLAQYPSSADDLFEMKLIDAVEKQQCIYNRCHPLHKMTDYKTHVWSQIAKEVCFSGPGVELERKWRHMRDRYVRLRKLVKTSQPLKKTDKWYYYYKKMSFLDPYVEHRNRRKRGDLLNSVTSAPTESQTGDGCESFAERAEDDASDSGEGEGDVDPLKGFYASFLNNPLALAEVKAPPETLLMATSTSSETAVVAAAARPSPSTSTAASTKRRKAEEFEEDQQETEVSLFVRSIQKTLDGMDAQTFAMARVEISRVLYECQYGGKK